METKASRDELTRQLRYDAWRVESDGDPAASARMIRAAEIIESQFLERGDGLSRRETEALGWLLGRLEDAECLTPGAIYSEEVSRNEVSLRVTLPGCLALSDDVCQRESKAIESYVQLALRTMLIQSGHYGLPLPVPLIPEHPSDEAAMDVIRRAAEQMKPSLKDE